MGGNHSSHQHLALHLAKTEDRAWGPGTTCRGLQSSNELWATQMGSDNLAELLQNLPADLEYTRLHISSSQMEIHSQMPGTMIEEEMDAAATESASTKGDIAAGVME